MPRISKESLFKEYKAVAKSRAVKAYIHFCLDVEDSFEDEIDDCIAAELEIFKSFQFKYLHICWKYVKVVVIELRYWVNHMYHNFNHSTYFIRNN